jgi:hypothetical protein
MSAHTFKITERHRRGMTDYVLTCSCGKLNSAHEYRTSADRAGRRHVAPAPRTCEGDPTCTDFPCNTLHDGTAR